MWPVTWAADGNLYAAAGDNSGSPMNFWKIVFLDAEGNPRPYHQAWPDSSKRSQLTLFEHLNPGDRGRCSIVMTTGAIWAAISPTSPRRMRSTKGSTIMQLRKVETSRAAT